MMQKDCTHDTNQQMNSMLPLLLSETENGSSDSLKTMLMFQMMSQGSGNSATGLDINGFLPMLMMNDEDSEMSETMKLLLISNIVGAGDYSGNFNMMLPLMMEDCDTISDYAAMDTCEKEQKDLMIMMMAMSSQSPDSGTSVNSILPMLLMNEEGNNELLMMFMMMNQQQCLPITPQPQPQPDVATEEVIYRTWRLNPDGTRTLIDENA